MEQDSEGQCAAGGQEVPAGGGAGLAETGEPRVDAALRRLRGLDALPVSEHPEIFEMVHGQLVEVLGELRAGPGAGSGPLAGSGPGAGSGPDAG